MLQPLTSGDERHGAVMGAGGDAHGVTHVCQAPGQPLAAQERAGGTAPFIMGPFVVALSIGTVARAPCDPSGTW